MGKKVLIISVAIIIAFIQSFAQNYEYFDLVDLKKSSNGRNVVSLQHTKASNTNDPIENLPRKVRVIDITRTEVKFKDILLEHAGTLAYELGDRINDIDSLVVRGPINDADFYTMWSSCFYGRLTVINLAYAKIQDDKLPSHAFWYPSEQFISGSEYVNCIPLRRIILPEGLKEIGELAFSYAIDLEEINFPSSLRAIKKRCFSDCISLKSISLIIPEGVKEIGYMAFVNCKSLTGNVVLPSTMKRINGGAFFSAKITACNFPDGLEEIDDAAFYATRLKEVILPNSCQSFPGDSHFALNYELEKVRFPDGMKVIPSSFVDNCTKLTEFYMPNSIEEIEDRAFWQCDSLKTLYISPHLKSIGTAGLYYCQSLKTINFPSTLEELGAESCDYWKRIEKIYCAAKIPPVCLNSELNPGWTPFGPYGDDFVNRTPQETPVYVPIGSADLYRSAWGWNYFTNIIETDNFPSAGIEETLDIPVEQDGNVYDLYGRNVKNLVPGNIYIQNGKKFIHNNIY